MMGTGTAMVTKIWSPLPLVLSAGICKKLGQVRELCGEEKEALGTLNDYCCVQCACVACLRIAPKDAQRMLQSQRPLSVEAGGSMPE